MAGKSLSRVSINNQSAYCAETQIDRQAFLERFVTLMCRGSPRWPLWPALALTRKSALGQYR